MRSLLEARGKNIESCETGSHFDWMLKIISNNLVLPELKVIPKDGVHGQCCYL